MKEMVTDEKKREKKNSKLSSVSNETVHLDYCFFDLVGMELKESPGDSA